MAQQRAARRPSKPEIEGSNPPGPAILREKKPLSGFFGCALEGNHDRFLREKAAELSFNGLGSFAGTKNESSSIQFVAKKDVVVYFSLFEFDNF